MWGTGRRVALVVGVGGASRDGPAHLRYAESDAQAVAVALAESACGFQLYMPPLLGEHATSGAVKECLLELADEIGAADTLLVYFSGHGQPLTIEADRRDVYLVTHDYNAKRIRRDENLGLSLRWLQDKVLRGSGAGRVLLVLDCCYAGAIGDAAPDPYWSDLQERLRYYLNIQSTDSPSGGGEARLTLAATSPTMPAEEGGGRGRFTAAFLDALVGGSVDAEGYVTVQRIDSYIKDALPPEQTSGLYGFDRSRRFGLAHHPDRGGSTRGGGSAFAIAPGGPSPLGATVDALGVNFAVFSQHATSVELLLFDRHDAPKPVQVIRLNTRMNKTFRIWHVYVRGLTPGYHYAYRVDGPRDVHASGHRFNPNKVLLDPYAKGITDELWDRIAANDPDDNVTTSMRCAVVDWKRYDWEDDRLPRWSMYDTIVYELHVGGFTKSPTSDVAYPGTFAGIIDKIPHLKDLGVTAVQLLPVFTFDDKEFGRPSPIDGTLLPNFWGYGTVGFFAPHHGYTIAPEEGSQVDEFRDMVKALHRAGIEVILDVVLDYTGEGSHTGPVINFKGLDNSVYYHLVNSDKQYYMDYSGAGNTLRCDHRVVDRLIRECLEFWVQEMHVDGFRFDEGSVLTRSEDGMRMAYPPVIWHIEQSAPLANSKILVEAWDAAGLCQIDYFPGECWAETNGRFRDDVRRYVRGDPGVVGAVASRIVGSPGLYQGNRERPLNSLNFVTRHDGFTLNDLVSYNAKHNEANGEANRDGIDENLSWNCGVEGPTDDDGVERLRNRHIKNFVAILMLSQGVPMILGGDEIRRTQQGNDNAYRQDNALSWVDWTGRETHAEIFRFFKHMIAFRKRHATLHQPRFFTGEVNERNLKDIDWHGCKLYDPSFDNPDCRVLAFTMGGDADEEDLHVMMNMEGEESEFEVPRIAGRRWYRAVDTAAGAPDDIVDPGTETVAIGGTYRVHGHSLVVLISRAG